MPNRQLVMLGGLVTLAAVIVAIIFFAGSHPLRGAALLVVAVVVGAFSAFSARRTPPAQP
ncbi:MAG TPA: hypothetical protein VGY97_10780 [Solirubrobacteraceae bacterium]|jgi:predicted signal transduction protein with EAL and GGDEF domain|nr:hypothetical protein [Solirubrobacteraceae bacterium]